MSNAPRTPSSTLREELLQNSRLNHASINGNVLATILNAKYDWLKNKKESLKLEEFKDSLEKSDRSFYDALSSGQTRFILECKKASPSKGLIRPDFSPKEIARVYDRYASAISVLTDEKFFQGKYEYISEVRKEVHVPVLCKDFIFDPYQVYLARFNNADAILLMLSVLTDEAYIELSNLAHSLNMGVLTESSTPEEIARGIKLNAKVMGINNRNLRNLTVDLNRAKELSALIPKDRIIISESGIYTHDQILDLKHYVKAFLVGSSLTEEADIDFACRKLIYGYNKICGITTSDDAIKSWHAGVCANGFIFAPKSKRYIAPKFAREIVDIARSANCKQEFVGVFVNEDIDTIVDIAITTPLNAVQLHGDESLDYVKNLRTKLPSNISIWKAIPVTDTYPKETIDSYLTIANKVVLDTKSDNMFGGTGKTFDWSMVNSNKNKILIAGGINDENAKVAYETAQTVGLDLNSGLESAPGIKIHSKIERAFAEIKIY